MIKYLYKPLIMPDGEVRIYVDAVLPLSENYSVVEEFSKAIEEYAHRKDHPVYFKSHGADRNFILANLNRSFGENDFVLQTADRDYPMTIQDRLKSGVGPEVTAMYRRGAENQRAMLDAVWDMIVEGRSNEQGVKDTILMNYKLVKIKI